MTINVKLAVTVSTLMGLFESGSAGSVMAQSAQVDTSIAAIVRAFREGDPRGRAPVEILRQIRGSQSMARREELADSLVAIAMSDSSSPDLSSRAVTALFRAVALDPPRGTAFEGSYPRLQRIALEGPPGTRAGALIRLSQVPDSPVALRAVSAIAVGGGPDMATLAVQRLGNDMGPRGTDELRRLLAASAIRDPRAKDQAESIAEFRGWGRRP